jgi:hypothetical protein
MEVKTKQECYRLYERGFFGNKPLTWGSFNEIIESGWKGGICMRGKRGIKREKTRYDLSLEEIRKEIKEWEKQGILENEIAFNQSMPNEEHLIIQGEMMKSYRWIELLYSTVKKPMNLALREESKNIHGLKALTFLRHYLYPSSYSYMMGLLELFPDSVVEFSTYDIPVGNIPGRNTVVWEVRNY